MVLFKLVVLLNEVLIDVLQRLPLCLNPGQFRMERVICFVSAKAQAWSHLRRQNSSNVKAEPICLLSLVISSRVLWRYVSHDLREHR
jgi:hypothetical protein